MNMLFKYIAMTVCAVAMSSCTPDTPELPDAPIAPEALIEGQAYTITPDAQNPNIIYLESKMKGYTPLWEHPQGRSQAQKVTLRIPFAGSYKVKFGVMTRGGHLYAKDDFEFEVAQNCLEFVSSELWINLSGGVGEQKTWVYDNGKYGQNVGEMAYADPTAPQEWHNFTCNWEPGPNHTGDKNIWGSTMTFGVNSEKGAFVEILNTYTDGEATAEKSEQGTFMLDDDTHSLSFTDCEIMHPQIWNYKTTNWSSKLRVLELTENQLRVAVLREASSGESEWWMVFNYVSKTWADENEAEPEPTLPDNFEDMIGQVTTTAIKWTLSQSTPFNWANLAGEPLNNFVDQSSYPDWTGWNTADPSTIAGFSLTLDSKDNKAEYVAPDGTKTSGTFELSAKGIYQFSFPIDFAICGWVKCQTNSDNQWRILSIKQNLKGDVTGMWVGARSGDEYMTYLLVPNAGGGSAPAPTVGTALKVDNSKVVYGHVETEKNNFRIELFNAYGLTNGKAPIDLAKLAFDEKISINFSIRGLNLKAGAVSSYKAGCYYASAGWSTTYDGKEDLTITGDGNYTLKVPVGKAGTGAEVFVVDIFDLISDLVDPASVFVTVNSIMLDGDAKAPESQNLLAVDSSKLDVGDLEENGNIRVEFFNEWGSTKPNPPIDMSKLAINEKLTINFRVTGATLKADAPTNYGAAIYYSDPTWSVQYDGKAAGRFPFGGASCDAIISGNGTYSVTMVAPSACSGAVVFVVDLIGLGGQVTDIDAVKVYVDSIILE